MSAEKELTALDVGNAIWDSAKKVASGVSDGVTWVGGTLAGEFNTKATIGQILTDAVISMIPVLGEATAARDCIAITLRMCDDPKKADDKWEWVSLVLCLLAVVPVIGGIVKGVGRLIIRAVNKAEDLAKLANEIVTFLRKMGYGDAYKFLKELNFAKYQSDVIGGFHELVKRLTDSSAFILKRFGPVLPANVKAMFQALPAKLKVLEEKGNKFIPEGIKELNAQLNKVRAKLVDGSYIVPISVGGKESKAMVKEGRLAEQSAAQLFVSKGHKPFEASILYAKGWPEIKRQDYIRSFSKLAPPTPFSIKPNQSISRVVDITDIRKAGAFWSEKMPASGHAWRSESAVLSGWSKNGGAIELQAIPTKADLINKGIKNIPSDWDGLRVWRGKIAEQTDDATKLLLPGGDIQLLIDWAHPHNAVLLEYIKALPVRLTGWKDVNLVATNSKAQAAVRYLSEKERSAKIVVEGYVERAVAVVGKQANNNQRGQK